MSNLTEDEKKSLYEMMAFKDPQLKPPIPFLVLFANAPSTAKVDCCLKVLAPSQIFTCQIVDLKMADPPESGVKFLCLKKMIRKEIRNVVVSSKYDPFTTKLKESKINYLEQELLDFSKPIVEQISSLIKPITKDVQDKEASSISKAIFVELVYFASFRASFTGVIDETAVTLKSNPTTTKEVIEQMKNFILIWNAYCVPQLMDKSYFDNKKALLNSENLLFEAEDSLTELIRGAFENKSLGETLMNFKFLSSKDLEKASQPDQIEPLKKGLESKKKFAAKVLNVLARKNNQTFFVADLSPGPDRLTFEYAERRLTVKAVKVEGGKGRVVKFAFSVIFFGDSEFKVGNIDFQSMIILRVNGTPIYSRPPKTTVFEFSKEEKDGYYVLKSNQGEIKIIENKEGIHDNTTVGKFSLADLRPIFIEIDMAIQNEGNLTATFDF